MATWLGVMLALSISNEYAKKTYIIITILISIWIIFEILSSLKMVPIWYLVTFPLTSIIGLYLSKITYKINKKHNALSST